MGIGGRGWGKDRFEGDRWVEVGGCGGWARWARCWTSAHD